MHVDCSALKKAFEFERPTEPFVERVQSGPLNRVHVKFYSLFCYSFGLGLSVPCAAGFRVVGQRTETRRGIGMDGERTRVLVGMRQSGGGGGRGGIKVRSGQELNLIHVNKRIGFLWIT